MKIKHAQDGALVPIGEAARMTSLSPDTLRRYADKGLIPVYRTPANHRRFKVADLRKIISRDAGTVGLVKAGDEAA